MSGFTAPEIFSAALTRSNFVRFMARRPSPLAGDSAPAPHGGRARSTRSPPEADGVKVVTCLKETALAMRTLPP